MQGFIWDQANYSIVILVHYAIFVNGVLVVQKRHILCVYPQKLNREAPHEDSSLVLEYKTFPSLFCSFENVTIKNLIISLALVFLDYHEIGDL